LRGDKFFNQLAPTEIFIVVALLIEGWAYRDEEGGASYDKQERQIRLSMGMAFTSG
jgi:hypothetical protein